MNKNKSFTPNNARIMLAWGLLFAAIGFATALLVRAEPVSTAIEGGAAALPVTPEVPFDYQSFADQWLTTRNIEILGAALFALILFGYAIKKYLSTPKLYQQHHYSAIVNNGVGPATPAGKIPTDGPGTSR